MMLKRLGQAAAVLLFLALIAGADAAREGARLGLALAFHMAVPALFPFFVAGTMLQELGVIAALGRVCARLMHRVYGLPGTAAGALILAFGGGYPVGVQAAADLYRGGYLTAGQTERLLGFCNNTGPAFIVGVCGAGVFGSVKIGILLYVIHVFCALLTGLAMTFAGRGTPPAQLPPRTAPRAGFFSALVTACERAAQSCIKVAAFVTLFAVLSAMLQAYGVLDVLALHVFAPVCVLIGLPSEAAYPLVYGLLELTRGLAVLPEAGLPLRFALPLASMLLAFGGFAVWCQSISLTADTGLSLRRCMLGKTLHALLAGAVTVLLTTFAPQVVPAFSAGALVTPVLPLPMRIIPLVFILCTFTYGKLHRNQL